MSNYKDIYKSINESLKKVYEDKQYLSIFFIQGEEADEFLKYFDEHGEDATIDWMFDQGYLSEEDDVRPNLKEKPWGNADYLYYTTNKQYVISINYNLPYFSVTEIEENAD